MYADPIIDGPSIVRVFDDICVAYRDRVALVDGAQSVTYGSLQRRAHQFARMLRGRGVLPGDVVAVLAGRSISTLIAIIGTLTAGAGYVPLDPAEPAERLRTLLGDCGAALVLVSETAGGPGVDSGRPTLDLNEALASASREGDGPLGASVGPDDVACVMYPSGSSGRPKGVVVPHRAVVRLVTNQTYAPFGPDETTLHLAPLTFDASTFEIWGALLNGGRLALVTAPQPSLDDIATAIQRHGATVAWFTAGLFSLLVDHRMDALEPLRCILTGGDVVSPAHVRRAYAGLPDCRIVNGYGPTENTTFTSCYDIPRDGWGGGPVPIGLPIRGTSVHVLGTDLVPVEPGEIGQICCGGDGVALRYLNQRDLTQAAFVRVGVNGAAGQRLYLTGDLGRRRPDGLLEFCGRTDFQVKIDGKRVELGDIEDELRTDPEIHDAAVLARPTPAGSKQLTAYLKPREAWASRPAAPWAAAALARLGARLPAYMVPTAAVVMSDLPLTTNGKVDRARLPAPIQPRPAHRRSGAPRTGVEDAVAAIWQDVLGVAAVDRDTNFFDLGGTSLLLMAVHERLQHRLNARLPLLALFDRTTVRSVAAALESAHREGSDRHAGSARPDSLLIGGGVA